VASVLGVGGPCYSILGDESAWVNAVGVAATWLMNGLVEHVLVIGAEEFDPIILDAYASVRWVRRNGRFIPSEGAGAMLLRLAQPSDVGPRVLAMSEGHPYGNPREARRAAAECLADFPHEKTVFASALRNWFAPIERELQQAHGWIAPAPLPYCGDAFTASAAWNTVRAVSLAGASGSRVLQPVWGLDEQCSALLLGAK
jgi:3-oxoacyl-[acyl-carrier-protein] synthase III